MLSKQEGDVMVPKPSMPSYGMFFDTLLALSSDTAGSQSNDTYLSSIPFSEKLVFVQVALFESDTALLPISQPLSPHRFRDCEENDSSRFQQVWWPTVVMVTRRR